MSIRSSKWRAIVRGILATRKFSQSGVYILAALQGWHDVNEFKCQDENCRISIRGEANVFDWHAGHKIQGHRARRGISGADDIYRHRFNVAYLRRYFYLTHGHCNIFKARLGVWKTICAGCPFEKYKATGAARVDQD